MPSRLTALLALLPVLALADPVASVPKTSQAVFAPDGKVLMTISADDQKVHFWSADTSEEVNRFGVAVTQAIFSADGKRIIVAGRDGAIRIHDVRTGKALRRLDGEFKTITALAISPDGSRVLTATAEQPNAILWDADTGKALKTIEGHAATVVAVAFSADGSMCLTATGVGPTPAGSVIVPGGPGNTTPDEGPPSNIAPPVAPPRTTVPMPPRVLEEMRRMEELKKLVEAEGRARALAMGPGNQPVPPPIPDRPADPVAPPAPPKEITVQKPAEQALRVWACDAAALAAGPLTPKLKIDLANSPLFAGFAPDGKAVWAASPNSFNAWKFPTGEALDLSKNAAPIAPAGRLSADRRMGLRTAIGQAVLIDPQTNQEIRAMEGPLDGLPLCQAFSSSAARVIIGTGKVALFSNKPPEPGSVYVYDVATGKSLAKFEGHKSQIVQVGLSPDGSRAFSRDGNGVVMVWKVDK